MTRPLVSASRTEREKNQLATLLRKIIRTAADADQNLSHRLQGSAGDTGGTDGPLVL